jgi:Fe-S-cluster containining protein
MHSVPWCTFVSLRGKGLHVDMQGAASKYVRYSHKMGVRFPSRGDQKLIQIVDAALADAAPKSGGWVACRPGCTQCCVGVFSINQLDALRLQRGLADLERRAPERAAKVRQRARESVARLLPEFPGDPFSGVLSEGEDAEEQFADFANDEPCPVLDPETGYCELYESRPMTCRVFGPPVRSEEGLGVCELCFQGASDKEIAACEIKPDPDGLESRLLAEIEKRTGKRGNTIIAFCLAS